MSSSTKPVIIVMFFFFLSFLFPIAQSLCSEAFDRKALVERNMSHCKKLTTLGVEFGWKLIGGGHPNPNATGGTQQIDIIFGAEMEEEMGWLAWGVNPESRPQMVGTRALIGVKLANSSLQLNTYNITKDTKLGCQFRPSEIEVKVLNKSIKYEERTGYLIIEATLILPSNYNISKLNHVWQVGYYTEGVQPKMHATALQNVDSTETIDLNTGRGESVGHHRRHLRTVHGILNIVGWGTLLPTGVIIARYLKKYPLQYKMWYVFHVSCQIAGYVLGTTGWVIGLWLGHASRYYTFHTHRMIAIFIFTFTTLQMLALRLRPKKNDDYRKNWNMYHHFLGYALLAVISFNIFKGIEILKPNKTWKWAYIGVLGVLGSVILAFEIFTWAKFLKERKNSPSSAQGDTKTGSQGDASQNKTTQPQK